MRCKFIQNDILNYLLDYKRHTLAEISQELQISYSTAKRHINELAMHYPIQTFVGGRDSGGIMLLKSCVLNGLIFSNEELSLILNGLKGLERDEKVESLLNKLETTKSK